MPAALWKMALGSLAWAVNAPAKPIPRAPCSKMANPAACAGAGPRMQAASAAARARVDVDIKRLLIGSYRRECPRAVRPDAPFRSGLRREAQRFSIVSGAVAECQRN